MSSDIQKQTKKNNVFPWGSSASQRTEQICQHQQTKKKPQSFSQLILESEQREKNTVRTWLWEPPPHPQKIPTETL